MLTSGFPEKEANDIINHLKVRERLKTNLVPHVKRKFQEKEKTLQRHSTVQTCKIQKEIPRIILGVSSMLKGISTTLSPIFNTH